MEREALKVNLSDFWATISKKYLNFLLYVCTMLQTQERAAIVVPYNPLFAWRGGAVRLIWWSWCVSQGGRKC